MANYSSVNKTGVIDAINNTTEIAVIANTRQQAQDHLLLLNTSTPGCHPTEAITGLDTILTNLQNNMTTLQNDMSSLATEISNARGFWANLDARLDCMTQYIANIDTYLANHMGGYTSQKPVCMP